AAGKDQPRAYANALDERRRLPRGCHHRSVVRGRVTLRPLRVDASAGGRPVAGAGARHRRGDAILVLSTPKPANRNGKTAGFPLAVVSAVSGSVAYDATPKRGAAEPASAAAG